MSIADDPREEVGRELLSLAERLGQLSHNLLHDERAEASWVDYAQLARCLIAERQRFAALFQGRIFADPARDILLDLFVAAEENRQISVSSCCIAAEVPSTTALRWIETLKRHSLIQSYPDPYDRRRVYVELTEEARKRIRSYLGGVAAAPRP